MTFGKVAVSCGPRKNSYEKSRRPFGWAAVIFYQKTVKGTHISYTIIPMRPSRERGAVWEGRGASTTMRAGTRAHKSRAAHPLDKACDALPGGEGRGAQEAVARGRRERRKKTQTGIYIINGKWVICMSKSQ